MDLLEAALRSPVKADKPEASEIFEHLCRRARQWEAARLAERARAQRVAASEGRLPPVRHCAARSAKDAVTRTLRCRSDGHRAHEEQVSLLLLVMPRPTRERMERSKSSPPSAMELWTSPPR